MIFPFCKSAACCLASFKSLCAWSNFTLASSNCGKLLSKVFLASSNCFLESASLIPVWSKRALEAFIFWFEASNCCLLCTSWAFVWSKTVLFWSSSCLITGNCVFKVLICDSFCFNWS